MNQPDISIVIPCYNAEAWVEDAVISALSQGYQSTEVIAVDDGSDDGTAGILLKYGSRITVIRQENRGVSAARNVGALASKGKYVRFLDSDDFLPSESISGVMRVVRDHPNCIVVGRNNVANFEGIIEDSETYNIGYRPKCCSKVKKEYLLTQPTHSSLWTIPRDLFVKGLHFDELIALGEEYSFSRKIVEAGTPVIYWDGVACTIRQHNGDRLSRRGKERDYLAQLYQIKYNLIFIEERIPDGDIRTKEIVAKRCWSLGRHCLRIGYYEAAERYFDFSISLIGSRARNGSLPYRLIAASTSPLRAERLIESVKALGRKWRHK